MIRKAVPGDISDLILLNSQVHGLHVQLLLRDQLSEPSIRKCFFL